MDSKPKIRKWIILIVGTSLLISLAARIIYIVLEKKISIKTPAGFALIKTKEPENTYKAISPEGVFFSIKMIKNKPKQNNDFWKLAVKDRLLKSGYTFLDEKIIESGKHPGTYFEWGAPLDNQDYIYVTAIMIFGDKIALCESSGEASLMKNYADDIVSSLNTLQYK